MEEDLNNVDKNQGIKKFNVYMDEYIDNPFYNIAVEEAIAIGADTTGALFTLRLWRNRNCIVIGRFQSPRLEINAKSCKMHGTSFVRRFTGGGAVYHDIGNLNFAFTFNKSYAGNMIHAYRFIGDAVIMALSKLGIKGEYQPINDIAIEGRKISGMAGTLLKNSYFIHGTLMVSSDIGILSEVLNVPKEKLEAKAVTSVKKRVTTLREVLGTELDIDKVKNTFVSAVSNYLHMVPEYLTLDGANKKLADELYNNRYRTVDWNMGKEYYVRKELYADLVDLVSSV